MEKLPLNHIRKNSLGAFHYTQIIRDDVKALYKVEFQLPHETEKKCCGYEMFFIKEQKEMDVVLGGQQIHYEAKEMLPGDNAFGKWAFFIHNTDEQNALNRFNNLSLDK